MILHLCIFGYLVLRIWFMGIFARPEKNARAKDQVYIRLAIDSIMHTWVISIDLWKQVRLVPYQFILWFIFSVNCNCQIDNSISMLHWSQRHYKRPLSPALYVLQTYFRIRVAYKKRLKNKNINFPKKNYLFFTLFLCNFSVGPLKFF